MIDELTQAFDEQTFCNFVNDRFSGSFSRRAVNLPKQKEFPWDQVRQLGIVKTLRGNQGENRPLVVVCAKLREGEVLTERSSRIRQFTFAKQVLDNAMANPAPGVEGLLSQGLFVFHDEVGNFRLSLVHGRADGTKLVWSTAKRLSFYVEAGQPNKTFRDRAALAWSSFDRLKEAFSVEKLTKEFYTRLFIWYQRAMASEEVVFPNDLVKNKEAGEVKSEQIIRLITRLMFVWFLKQKHLVPNELFDPESLATILKEFDPGKGENYYRAILQNLFFATLNTEISDRAFAIEGSRQENEEHFGVKIFYRYAAEFALSEEEVIHLFRSIPFMNGGLFECLDRDNHYYDGFSRRKNKRALVPNALFFDDKGLIPLLSQYNFTVEENSPGDEDVALDPEMLGKVFENLLAAYNPETNSQARKATGSFYTPREIVNYMVDESLIAHLTTRCGEEHADAIRKLFTDGKRPEAAKLCKAMDAALVSAKILDPACGSGAFPMGILLRMVELLRILREIPEEASVYDLKLELIENCIYGGDIQCIAVQISKLRFFISLVCEQKPTADPTQNYGIHTLPNLETKFVAADSLIGLPKTGKDVLDLCTGDIAELKTKLWKVRHRHFLAKSYQEKKELRKRDKALRNEIKTAVKQDSSPDRKRLELLLSEREKVAEPKWVAKGPKAKALEMFAEFDAATPESEQTHLDAHAETRKRLDAEIARERKKITLPSTDVDKIADMLADWDPYDQNISAPFSDPEWMFNVKDGFDVVIGNPPYVSHDRIRKKEALEIYAVYEPFADLYCFFIEKGINLLVKNGILCFITSNSYIKADYGEPLRRFLSSQAPVNQLLNIEDSQIFNAAIINVAVILSIKGKRTDNVLLTNTASETEDFFEFVSENSFFLKGESFLNSSWSLVEQKVFDIKEKMRTKGISLEERNAFIRLGLATGSNNAFLLSPEKAKEIIENDIIYEDIVKPVLRGRDIDRYGAPKPTCYLILAKNGVDINKYPIVLKHLNSFGDKFKKRGAKGQKWWNLRSCAFYEYFLQSKVVWIELTDRARFTCCEGEMYLLNTAYFMTPPENLNIKYLTAVLNSKCISFFFRQIAATSGMGTTRWINAYVKQFPIPDATPSQQAKINSFVDRILEAKKADTSADTTALEAEIDQLVYKLYGLTPEEIEIIESSTAQASTVKAKKETTPKSAGPKAATHRSKKTQLPPSLPGWD